MRYFAEFDDVDKSFEGTVPEEMRSYIETKIEEAETLLRSRVPRLLDIMAATEMDRLNARRVVCAAVLRVFRNPTGVQQQSSGPWSVTLSMDNATGVLDFTADELSVFGGGRRRKFGMVGVSRPWYV
jgi:hypothetical protein